MRLPTRASLLLLLLLVVVVPKESSAFCPLAPSLVSRHVGLLEELAEDEDAKTRSALRLASGTNSNGTDTTMSGRNSTTTNASTIEAEGEKLTHDPTNDVEVDVDVDEEAFSAAMEQQLEELSSKLQKEGAENVADNLNETVTSTMANQTMTLLSNDDDEDEDQEDLEIKETYQEFLRNDFPISDTKETTPVSTNDDYTNTKNATFLVDSVSVGLKGSAFGGTKDKDRTQRAISELLEEYDRDLDQEAENDRLLEDAFSDSLLAEQDQEEADQEEPQTVQDQDESLIIPSMSESEEDNDEHEEVKPVVLHAHEESTIKEEILASFDKFFEDEFGVDTKDEKVESSVDNDSQVPTMEAVLQYLEDEFVSTQEELSASDNDVSDNDEILSTAHSKDKFANAQKELSVSSENDVVDEVEILSSAPEAKIPSLDTEQEETEAWVTSEETTKELVDESFEQTRPLAEVTFASVKSIPHYSRKETKTIKAIAGETAKTGQRLSAADELAQKFDSVKLDEQKSMPKIEVSMPKIEMPKIDEKQVEQAMDTAKKGIGAFVKGLAFVAKESVDLAMDVKNKMNTTKIDDTMTYGEALDKVATGAKGFAKVCGIFGGFVKESITIVAEEIKHKNEQNQAIKKAQKAIDASQPKRLSASSLADPSSDSSATVIDSPILSVEDMTPQSANANPAALLEGQVGDTIERATSILDNIRSTASNALDDDTSKVRQQATARDDPLDDIKSKANAMFGDFLSNAANFMDDVAKPSLPSTSNHGKVQSSKKEPTNHPHFFTQWNTPQKFNQPKKEPQSTIETPPPPPPQPVPKKESTPPAPFFFASRKKN